MAYWYWSFLAWLFNTYSIQLSPEGEVNNGKLRTSVYISRCSPTLRGVKLFWYLPNQLDKTEKKELFVSYRRHLVGTLFTIYEHFGDYAKCIFWFCCKFSLKIIFLLPVNINKPKFVAFLAFVCTNGLFIVSKWDAILARVAKQWIAKNISSYSSQKKRTKFAIHWFGKY